MARHRCTAHRHLQLAQGLTLFLAILVSAGLARDATAAPVPPIFLGTFTSGGLCSPRGIGLSPSGVVYLGSDCSDPQHMERFTASGVPLSAWDFFPGYLGPPNGVALDGSGNVFVTDYEGSRLHKYTGLGAFISSWATAFRPVDIAVNSSGDVFVAIQDGKVVQKFSNGGTFLGTIGSAGVGPGQFQDPSGIAVDAIDRIYVADFTRMRILRFLADGSFDMEFAVPASPSDVAVGPDGNIYVVRSDFGLVHQYSAAGTLLQTFSSPNGLLVAYRIAISPSGVIYIVEQNNNRVTMFQIDRVTSAAHTTFGRLKAMYR